MMNGVKNMMRAQAVGAMGGNGGHARIGQVTSYDPGHYAAKVMLQPEGAETGWLPVLSEWVGAEWGLYCPPTPGDTVMVLFQEGGREAGVVGGRMYGALAQPLPVQSGEFWLVHKSGSLLKFHNDGSVEVTAASNMTLTAAQVLRMVGQSVQIHANGDLKFDADGNGEHWRANTRDSYVIGSTGTPHNISPAEVP